MEIEELKIEGRNAVLEAFRSGRTIDKLFVLDGCKDGPVQSIMREAKRSLAQNSAVAHPLRTRSAAKSKSGFSI